MAKYELIKTHWTACECIRTQAPADLLPGKEPMIYIYIYMVAQMV
jgi:hypothetical protein